MGRVEKGSALQLLLAQDKDRSAVAKVRRVLLIGYWILSSLALNESEAGVELCVVRNLTSFKRTSFSYAYELNRGFLYSAGILIIWLFVPDRSVLDNFCMAMDVVNDPDIAAVAETLKLAQDAILSDLKQLASQLVARLYEVC